MKKCEFCDSLFELKSIRHPNQRYCSKRCIKEKWIQNNPEADRYSKRVYAENNKAKHTQATEKYRKENQGYYREYASLRTRKVKQAKPTWLNEFELFYIVELYDLAVRRNLHVDHIIPITNKLVCGLHVPWNLQLLTKVENLRKHNKFNPNEDLVAILTGKNND